MTKASNPTDLSDAYQKLYQTSFYEMLVAPVRSKQVEEAFAKFPEARRLSTRKKLRKAAEYAAWYVVQSLGNPPRMSKKKAARITPKALEFALNKISNE